MRGDLADGEDVRIGRAHRVVDDDPAARADLEAAGARQLVAGPDARRDHDHVDVEPPAVGERQALHLAVAEELPRALAQVDPDVHSLDLLEQRLRARLVDLPGHQPRGELDDVGLEAQVADRLRGLQAEQAAADHRRRARLRRRRRGSPRGPRSSGRRRPPSCRRPAPPARTARSRWPGRRRRSRPRGPAPRRPPAARGRWPSTRSPTWRVIPFSAYHVGQASFRCSASRFSKYFDRLTRSYAGRGSSQNVTI